MTSTEIKAGLHVLCAYYTDKGAPHVMNDVQLSVYLAGLARFSAAEFEGASRQWMHTSRWFPALSDLLHIMTTPALPVAEQAALAWAAVERAIRQVGQYRAVQFEDSAIGETVRQTFGTWAQACDFDFDSAGWHGRRQQFAAIYPSVARRAGSSPVLGGLHRDAAPAVIAHIEGLPDLRHLAGAIDAAASTDEAAGLLASLRPRVIAQKAGA